MCFSPLTIKRPYKSLQGDFTDVVPCGKCHKCLRRRANSWAFRLWKQMDVSESAAFITLTYADEPESFNGHGTLVLKDLQDFMKRLRKKAKTKIKYYAVGEYGTIFKRPHYHLIVFGIPQAILCNSDAFAEDIWQHGKVDIARCNIATIFYTVGYIMKGKWQPEQDDDDRAPEFATMSKNLGLNYLSDEVWDWHLSHMVGYVTQQNGSLMPMPRYYRDKIFSRDEKAELNAEAKMIRELDFNSWINYDYTKELERKKDELRRHNKEQRLKRMKL